MAKRKLRIERSSVLAAVLVLAVLSPAVWFLASAMHFQNIHREFVHALSEATVYCYENGSLTAEGEQTVTVDGKDAYDLYFLFTKKQGKRRLQVPQEPPQLVLTYGEGSVLECWNCRMEPGARRSWGVFWRFTAPDGRVWMYDTDDLSLSKLQRVAFASADQK